MMLRSSSTPVLGSLLSSSETHNRDFENSSSNNNNKHPSSSDHSLKKISFSHGGIPHFSAFSCNSSPISHSVVTSDFDREPNSASSRGFRRARSDGNLEGLAAASCDLDDHSTKPLTRASRRPSMSVLETIPSYSVYSSRDGSQDEDEVEQEKEDMGQRDGFLGRSVTIGDFITAMGSGEFSFGKNSDMGLIVEEELSSGMGEEKKLVNPPLYLARGIGIEVDGLGDGGAGGGGGCGGSGGGFSPGGFGQDGGKEGSQIEEYYKRSVEENPSNPLFLRNYAQFLYQSKGDLQGAEEYYSRAILADPTDGEIMSQYAELLWELYHDWDRASSYFDRAIQAAPEDNHVLAAYASFLWETENEEEEEGSSLPQGLAGVPAYNM